MLLYMDTHVHLSIALEKKKKRENFFVGDIPGAIELVLPMLTTPSNICSSKL